MKDTKYLKLLIIFFLIPVFLSSCVDGKIPGGDASKYPPDPDLRVKKNLEEGRGFRLQSAFGKDSRGGKFDFASSNELWRASLDTLDFIPLSSANYSGGIIITDWYSSGDKLDESVKISVRFLTNEIRSDALDIKIFYKKCDPNARCKVIKKTGNLVTELKKSILRKATIYEKQAKKKNSKEYPVKDSINN